MKDSQQLGVVSQKDLRALSAAGAVQGATIQTDGEGGLIVILEMGEQRRLLGHARKREPRRFMSFDAAASALQQNGITTFRGEPEGWTQSYQTYRNGGS